MIDKVKEKVYALLKDDNSGHGIGHIERVFQLSLKFSVTQKAKKEVVSLIALVHDVDDYKLFGNENAKNLTNAKRILNECCIEEKTKDIVLSEIACIGYSKLLDGKRPKTIEGKIVSDADMCDALGATGILRVYSYHLKHNSPFFDKNIFPIQNVTSDNYAICAKTGVCNIFEKALKLKNLMLTDSGKREAETRHEFVISFLKQLFYEENVPEWEQYLQDYLNRK